MEYYGVVSKEVSTAQYCAYGVFDIAGPTEHYQIKCGQAYVGDGGGRKMPPPLNKNRVNVSVKSKFN